MRALFFTFGIGATLLWPGLARSSPIKEIARLRSPRHHQLLGYGLVVGLAGTGDKTLDFTDLSLGQALKEVGLDLNNGKIQSKNTAAVVCSVILPPFAKAGTKLDVTVSSIGATTSLQGGTLLLTPLRAPDGSIFARAQGRVALFEGDTDRHGLFHAPGSTNAQIRRGAVLDQEVTLDLSNRREVTYELHAPDFNTAARLARRINEELAGKYASPIDAGSVEVVFPYRYGRSNPVDLVTDIENIDVETDRIAKVILNQRTRRVVQGEYVRVTPVAIAPRNWHLEVKAELKGGTNIADIVATLNEMGASVEDLVNVLQSLKASGALLAEVEVQ